MHEPGDQVHNNNDLETANSKFVYIRIRNDT